MIDIEKAFHRIAASSFRRKFHLRGRELAYLETWGIDRVMEQAAKFIDERLAPASPGNDGRQTPWGNHPVFVAQHATGTCCRGCLEKTHEIGRGRELTGEEKAYVLGVIERWLREQG
jgi:Domain of unknown function (DUF4186)